MKFLFSLVSLGFAAVTAAAKPMKPIKMDTLKADSPMGRSLLSQARRVENDNEEADFTWVADFSIKFQGCHAISQWNEEADGEEDVRIQTKRLVRFRLCPTNSCSIENAGGCNSGYGDYIIDMQTFLESYFEAMEDYNDYLCEYTRTYSCDCEDDDGKGDDFDEEKCEYDCFVANGIEEVCADNNPYVDDQEEEQERFELREYMECKNVDFPEDEDDNNNRKLEQDEEEEIEYFVGPYCAEDGGAIYLGLFTDETCTTFAGSNGGSYVYKQLAGDDLPYYAASVITMDCFDCKEPAEIDENDQGNDNVDEDQVIEMCEQIYQTAGKCETGLGMTGIVAEPNENACNYISGIKVSLKNGVITQASSNSSKTASIFIGIFVVAFVLLVAYVYYLKTKLDRASINISD
eukprot:CAMPEP_0119570598 /NCGR_PEP_ID=MMETSP1352-20130426/43693_1 /TAXON_ID=265584 /ORGANISM="Stauroneis constricta, Strain CCMP1120" /LENGTH=404 /DNA_ID=CAMNT_0007620267 /DNA_START=48 /DNA_END=1262 /DNA_ORIENTATION=+